MHDELWQQIDGADLQAMADRALCRFLSGADRLEIDFLGQVYAVEPAERRIERLGDEPEPAVFVEQLCLLAYLINAKDIPPTGRLVKVESLPAGQFFFRGHHALPTNRLAELFGDDPERLCTAAQPMAAKKAEFRDASVRIQALPRLPITLILWGADEDFDARASILFDAGVAEQIPLDALGALVQWIVKKLETQIGRADG